jgi:hypothetical protein
MFQAHNLTSAFIKQVRIINPPLVHNWQPGEMEMEMELIIYYKPKQKKERENLRKI